METPACPDKRHKNSTVVRAGWYGREGQRRQRWWCQPKTGERHRFTETLPRITAGLGDAHSCVECQTTLQPWEGQPAPRLYGFSARDVAWALTQVAGGASYRGTAAAVRDRAGRPLEKRPGTASNGKTKLPPATQHGQLVSDWVDVFAPVIWSAYAPTTWPDAVLLDEDTFKHRVGDGSSAVAFYVLGAMARDDRGRSIVAAVEAVPKLSIAAWDRFLRSLDGQPSWVVTDGGGPVLKGASKAWPDARKWRCEWHLKRNLTDSLPSTVQRELTDPLHGKLAYAQLSEENWDAYSSCCAGARGPSQGSALQRRPQRAWTASSVPRRHPGLTPPAGSPCPPDRSSSSSTRSSSASAIVQPG